MRGTGGERERDREDGRFSPACAGNGEAHRAGARGYAVQPRVCGERLPAKATRFAADGSAPRVRGTDNPKIVSLSDRRFSPACAGNGSRQPRFGRSSTVQPRVCGERGIRMGEFKEEDGSAPRVRGTAQKPVGLMKWCRFSPACAGNGTSALEQLPTNTVQPRVCGERRAISSTRRCTCGSAPRVRGTDATDTDLARQFRFSPACAGNGCAACPSAATCAVQPRVCGERHDRRAGQADDGGSAPRVRGTVQCEPALKPRCRFSPACAGNGFFQCFTHRLTTVQPRVCGERSVVPQDGISQIGSAPRVRGTDAGSF